MSGISSLPPNAVIPTKYLPVPPPPPPDPCAGLTLITDGDFIGKYYDSQRIVYNDCTKVNIVGFNGIRDDVTSLVIPNTVINITLESLNNLTGMTSLTLGTNVQTIGESAFSGCSSLTSLVIPNSVTSIGNGAFLGSSSLTSLTLGNSLITIGDNAFQNASPTLIVIPDSVTTINQYAFLGNTNSEWAIRFGVGSQLTSLGNLSFRPDTSENRTINVCNPSNPPNVWDPNTAFGDLINPVTITVNDTCP